MDIILNELHEAVALKFNEEVYFNKAAVSKVIEENHSLFKNLDLRSINNSKMLYGYNSFNNPLKLCKEDGLVKRIVLTTKANNLKRFKVCISFDGHSYSGFQIQKDLPTIQGVISKVISEVNDAFTLIQGSSRTDAGVHAMNYIFHFDSDKPLSQKKWFDLLSHQLPDDILVKSVNEVHPLFHSRYDVYKKRYIYKITLNEKNPFKLNYEWFVKDLDVLKLKSSLNELIGTYDFTSFCKGNPDSTVRTIYKADLNQVGNELLLIFEGNGFLRYMIRIIVNTLVLISQSKLDLSIKDILKERSRKHTKNLAPASGLYLEEIIY